MKLAHKATLSLTNQDIEELIPSTYRFNTFINNIPKISQKKHPNDVDAENKSKGDLFEIFCEFLIKHQGHDTRIGITDYEPTNPNEDYGIDGIGKSTLNQKTATIQIKYRTYNHVLTTNEDNLSNFFTRSLIRFGEEQFFPTNNANMLIITSSGTIHHTVNQMCNELCRFITNEGLRELTDNIQNFWENLKQSLIESRPTLPFVPPPKKLREHQIQAVEKMMEAMDQNQNKLIVDLPTATGKTLIQAETILRSYQKHQADCVLILSPYILLTYQHLREIASHLISNNIDAEYLNISSGSFDDVEIREMESIKGMDANRIISTTDPNVIKQKYEAAMQKHQLLIISSTYQSALQIKKAGITPQIQMNDEAHYITEKNETYCLNIATNSFSFTASPSCGCAPKHMLREIQGPNGKEYIPNKEIWGDRFYRFPREMIEAGEMMKPILHMVETIDKDGQPQHFEDNDYDAIWRCIIQSYEKHQEKLYQDSADKTKIAAKLLVTLDSQASLKGILESDEYKESLKTRPENHHLYAISSDVGSRIDDQIHTSSSKDTFLQALKAMPNEHGAIILYVDMLTEGIDVPGITAYMPMRNIGANKFKQGLGRASRLCPQDREKFYAGKITPQANGYIKPFSSVIIPTVIIDSEMCARKYIQIWKEILTEYGSFQEITIITHIKGLTKISKLQPINELARLIKSSNSGLKTFIHHILDNPQSTKLDIDDICYIKFLEEYDEEITEKVFGLMGQKKKLQTLKTIAAYNKATGRTFEAMVKESRAFGQGVFSDQVKAKFGTIYTPDFVIEKTVDLALKHIDPSQDKTTLKYCDPAAGDGNFFKILHQKLMNDLQFIQRFPNPIERSHHIISKNIYGIEILKAMYQACKIRLLLLHCEIIKNNNGQFQPDLINQLHIYHGNTILTPEDDLVIDESIGEGGLLPEEIRQLKYDVIIGNPPYTHLRNRNNYRYKAYPNQRDMAQVFVRWALDHVKL